METMLTPAHEGRARRVLVLDATTRVLLCRRPTDFFTARVTHSRTHTECFCSDCSEYGRKPRDDRAKSIEHDAIRIGVASLERPRRLSITRRG